MNMVTPQEVHMIFRYTDKYGDHKCEIRGEGELAFAIYQKLTSWDVSNLEIEEIPVEQ